MSTLQNAVEENGEEKVIAATGPILKMIYKSPEFCGPYPNISDGPFGEVLLAQGGASVARISPNLVVKYGTRVRASEAANLLFVRRSAPSIPVPKVYACYEIGPYDRDLEEVSSAYDTYIIMDFLEGQTLEDAWVDLNENCKTSVAEELRAHMQQLRSIPSDKGSMIGSINSGPLRDFLFETHTTQGPFSTEDEFNAALVHVCEKSMPRANIRHILEGALAQNKHKTVFTHGDLRRDNIIIHQNKVAGIIDWELSGWYPEYWEFAKCFSVWAWPRDWPTFVSQVLEPYFCQWAVYDMIKRHVW